MNKFVSLRNLFEKWKITSLEKLKRLMGLILKLPTPKGLVYLPEEFVFIKSKDKKIKLTPYLKISGDLKPEVSYEFLIGEYIEILVKPKYIVEQIEGELYLANSLSKKSNIFEKLKSLIISTQNPLSYNQKFTFQKEDKFYKALVKLPENPGIYHLTLILIMQMTGMLLKIY